MPGATRASQEPTEVSIASSFPTNRTAALLEVSGLRTAFPAKGGPAAPAVDGVDLAVAAGEILGLVGESGSGKTVLALSILRLVPSPGKVIAGRVLWKGRDIAALRSKELQAVRGSEVAMIFQNPHLSLNPVYSIGRQISAVLRLHRGLGRRDAKLEAMNLLERVGFPDPARRFDDYPHELSGGLCQRAMIAMALGCRPSLLIADEPTSSLDVTIQAQITDLLLELRASTGMAILLISHDLGVVAQACDRVAVMSRGKIVEEAPAVELYREPRHPYTRLLLESVPVPDPTRRRRPRADRISLSGVSSGDHPVTGAPTTQSVIAAVRKEAT